MTTMSDCTNKHMMILKYHAIILKTNYENEGLEDPVAYLENIFQEKLAIFQVTEVVPSLLEYYEEPLFHVKCAPSNPRSLISVANKWCKTESQSNSNLDRWLKCSKHMFEMKLAMYHVLQIFQFGLGTLTGLNTLVEHFQWDESILEISECLLHLNHAKKSTRLYFTLKNSEDKYFLEVLYSSIQKFLLCTCNPDGSDLHISLLLAQPALLYRHDEKRISGFSGRIGKRLSNVIGMCNVLRISAKETLVQSVWESLWCWIPFCSHSSVYFSPLNIIESPEGGINFELSHFGCMYALQCVISRSFEVQDQVLLQISEDILLSLLEDKIEANPDALEKGLFEIQLAMDKGNTVIFLHALNKLFDSYCILKEERRGCIQDQVLSSSMTSIRKIFITPSRIIFLQPQPYLKSRLLRYIDADFALKVSVREDNLQKLWGHDKNFFVFTTIKEKLAKGICIGKKHFTVLGCSTSQLRSHSLWFYSVCDSKGRNPKKIREEIGDFTHIKNVPKYLSRVGMTLSQAQANIVVPQSSTNVSNPEADFLSEDSQYTFSDGIGKVSEDIVEQIYVALKKPIPKPCAFQIRYAGCKGMVLLDPTLPKERIVFRKSMCKFSSQSDSLEIIKISEPRPVYLNRPLITILEQMGVRRDVFLRLQIKTLQRLCYGLMYDEYAIPLLQQYCHLSIPFAKLSDGGFQLTSEPFFRSLLFAVTLKVIDELKMKARIPIPFQYGRTMFGVLDETGTLNYGEVFVQYSTVSADREIKRDILPDGMTVLVTRNPCMHPGDVRKLKARNIPALHHVCDCIVFPAKGPRPHPDEMSGGDLDGDEYVVIWHKDLIFPRNNYQAMDFSKNEVVSLERSIQDEDFINFLIVYMQNDYTGVLGNSHLIFADMLEQGIFSELCFELARKYYISLDYIKSGYFEKPKSNEWPFHYPDFMGKQDSKSTYVSEKVLGDLYRRCALLETGISASEGFLETLSHPTAKYPGWEEFAEAAYDAYCMYKGMITSLMKMYDADNEGALISGAFIKNQKYLLERNDDNDARDILHLQVKEVFQRMKQLFYAEFEITAEDCDEDTFEVPQDIAECMLKKASAWYMVSHHGESKAQFWGFPWVVSKLIFVIKHRIQPCSASENSLVPRLDKHILKMLPQQSLATKEDKIFKAIDILYHWAYQQRDLLYSWEERDFKRLKGCISRVFWDVLDPISEEEYSEHIFKKPKLVLEEEPYSPARTILDCLQNLAMTCFSRPPKQKEGMQYELGILAVFTLHRIAATGKLTFLGLSDEDKAEVELGPTESVIPSTMLTEQLRVSLKKDLCCWIESNKNEVEKAIKKFTGVENVVVQVKRTPSGTPYLHLFARDNCWILQRLKGTVIQRWFARDLEKLANHKF